MSKRRLDEKKLREIQMRNGNRGPGGRFGGLKEKPKDIKKTLKQLMKYIGYSKKLLIGLIIVVILSTACTLMTNVMIERIIKSLGTYEVGLGFTKDPNLKEFITFLVILAGIPVIFSNVSGLNSSITIGGTGILIVVGVAIETYKQIESGLVSRNYGRMRKRK